MIFICRRIARMSIKGNYSWNIWEYLLNLQTWYCVLIFGTKMNNRDSYLLVRTLSPKGRAAHWSSNRSWQYTKHKRLTDSPESQSTKRCHTLWPSCMNVSILINVTCSLHHIYKHITNVFQESFQNIWHMYLFRGPWSWHI